MAAEDYTHPVSAIKGLSTEYATAVLVLGSLAVLILIRRGFRGLRVPGVGSISAA